MAWHGKMKPTRQRQDVFRAHQSVRATLAAFWDAVVRGSRRTAGRLGWFSQHGEELMVTCLMALADSCPRNQLRSVASVAHTLLQAYPAPAHQWCVARLATATAQVLQPLLSV